MDKLSVCLINDSFPPVIDGVANTVVNYATHLTALGDQAVVATPTCPGADDSAYPFPVVRYPSVQAGDTGYRAGMPFSLPVMESLSQYGFQVLHAHCPITSTFLARTLREQVQAPVILTYHTKFDIEIANTVRVDHLINEAVREHVSKAMQSQAVRYLIQNIEACDEVWCVSGGAAENLRHMGFQGECIVMPNGVDLPRGRVDEAAVQRVCAGLDLPENVPCFLFVGRMMWYKGLRLILDALKSLDEAGRDFRMVFVGGGADREEIRAYASELALDGKVFFVDPVQSREELKAWYCRGDLFLFPSTFDTNGLVVREAASVGLASVLVRGSCAAEGVTDGRNAFLIEENAASLAVLLERLLPEPDTLRRVGEAAQRELYLSWEDAVRHARERYGVVRENYLAGRYPRKESVTEEIFRRFAKVAGLYNESLARARQLKKLYEEQTAKLAEEFLTDVDDLLR